MKLKPTKKHTITSILAYLLKEVEAKHFLIEYFN